MTGSAESDLLIAGIVIGVIGGFPLGRWHADIKRARHAMNKTWNDRSNYRKGNDKK